MSSTAASAARLVTQRELWHTFPVHETVKKVLKIIISFVREDRDLKDELLKHLTFLRHKNIDIWSANDIRPGEDPRMRFQQELERSDIALLLISADYIASEHVKTIELTSIFEQKERGLRVVPILGRPCIWESDPRIAHAKPLPENGLAISLHEKGARDRVFKDVAERVKEIVDYCRNELQQAPDEPPNRGHLGSAVRGGIVTIGSAVYAMSPQLLSGQQPTKTKVDTRDISGAHGSRDAKVGELVAELGREFNRKKELEERGLGVEDANIRIRSIQRELRAGGILRAGDRLGNGRYFLEKCVGQGGFAFVWRATDEMNGGAVVAIKVLRASSGGESMRIERFFRGAATMESLEDDAIVRVIEKFGEDDGWYYFVMEFLSGGDLRQAIAEKSISPMQGISAVLRVGEALGRAHELKYVHRDIKPANILLDDLKRPKLTDFDLVSALEMTGGTRTNEMMGTWIYSAPELLGAAADADARADVFSLGMTSIFCLRGTEPTSLDYKNIEPLIDGLACSSHIKKVLKCSVQWERADRFSDARAFCQAMELAIDPSSVVGEEPDETHELDVPDRQEVKPTPGSTATIYRCAIFGCGFVARLYDLVVNAIGDWNERVGREHGVRIEPDGDINSCTSGDLGILLLVSESTDTQEVWTDASGTASAMLIEGRPMIIGYFQGMPGDVLEQRSVSRMRMLHQKKYLEQRKALRMYVQPDELREMLLIDLTVTINEMPNIDGRRPKIQETFGADIRISVTSETVRKLGFGAQADLFEQQRAIVVAVLNQTKVNFGPCFVYIRTADGREILLDANALMGEANGSRSLAPREMRVFYLDPMILDNLVDDMQELACVVIADDRGRRFRSASGELKRSME